MEVGLSSEQESFRQSVAKLATDLNSAWGRGKGPATVDRCVPSKADWDRIVEAGWLSLRSDDGAGGLVGTCVDVCVLVEQLGYHTVPAPVIGTILVTEQLRLRGANATVLDRIADGTLSVAPILTLDLRDFAATADGVAFDTAGVELGVSVGTSSATVRLVDSNIGADLTRQFAKVGETAQVPIPILDGSVEADQRATAFALTVISADLLGTMHAALDAAVEHAKVRKQFNQPIGSFQAVQHIAAEALVSVEATRSAVWYAAWSIDELPSNEALSNARTAKAFASAAAIEVVEAAIQIFGGIGITWESALHVLQRRAHLDRRLFGDEHSQYRRLADANR